MMRQAIMNILTNACQAVTDGTGFIRRMVFRSADDPLSCGELIDNFLYAR